VARGVPTDIGPIGSLAPPAANPHGRIVGLIPALKTLGVVGTVGGALAGATIARHGAKDYNDEETFDIKGQAGGRLVQMGGSRPWSPAQAASHATHGDEDPFASPEEERAAFEHARKMGKANRSFYHEIIGTPKHRPIKEDPFGLGVPSHKPMDTSDLRNWTP